MKSRGFLALVMAFAFLIITSGDTVCQYNGGIDPEALIERILAVEAEQKARVTDIVFETEFVGGEQKKEGFEEKARFNKKVYLKFLTDTTLFYEEYLEYYEDGELQPDEECQNEAKDRKEKKKKRKARDISEPMLRPFYPDCRSLYSIEYRGVAEESIDGHTCHQFTVTAHEKVDTLINGDFYFDAETFLLVRADFSPAKLVKKLGFSLKKLDMSIHYAMTPDRYWLPRLFEIDGKGKAAFLFGVSFSGREQFRNAVVNNGLLTELFEDNSDE